MTFLELLRGEGAAYDRLVSGCEVSECSLFGDLCWGDGLDLATIFDDPGIKIVSGSRLFVLLRILGEIRYYAGSSDPNIAYETESESGVFPSAAAAVAFAQEFLINSRNLSEIDVVRTRKSAVKGSALPKREAGGSNPARRTGTLP
jgi:hypothetical protein